MSAKSERIAAKETLILLSAQGRPFTQQMAMELAQLDRVAILCGRYEGVDERINELLCDREVSIGDYILSGGELAAAVIVDAVTRLLPGVLGNPDSSRFESFGAADSGDAGATEDGVPRATHGSGGLLDYPHYTRPATFHGVSVPEVLMGGDHSEVRRWRRRMALRKTLRNRPDLLLTSALTAEDQTTLADLRKEAEIELQTGDLDSQSPR
jgi:tRNA (guanine37-N1)-methyltransferase